MNTQDWSPLGWTDRISLHSKGLSRVFSPTPQLKSINSWVLSFLYSPTLTSINDYWKNHTLNRRTFVGEVMSLLFNMLSRLVIEKAMATHFRTLAWKVPCTEKPGRLQSVGSLRVRHDWATSLSLFTFMHWRRKWQPTPVFLPGESEARGSLVSCCLWYLTESDKIEAT